MEHNIISEFFEISSIEESRMYNYFCTKYKYIKRMLNKDKSVSFNEAYIMYLLFKKFNITTMTELGVRYGISSRIWLTYLPQNGKLYAYDRKKIYDKRIKKIRDDRFNFIKGDIDNTYKYQKEDAIFYDAHPYHLTKNIAEYTKNKINIHCFHDVGKNCFLKNSYKVQDKLRSTCSDKYGWWERHIMAEVFTPGILHNDISIDREWKSLVVDDVYGVGVVINRSL